MNDKLHNLHNMFTENADLTNKMKSLINFTFVWSAEFHSIASLGIYCCFTSIDYIFNDKHNKRNIKKYLKIEIYIL